MSTAVKPVVRHKWTWVEMLISSLLSLTASLVLSVDAWKLAGDPNVSLSCNVSKLISCTTVAKAWQSTLLGWPNAFLGLICEPVVITIDGRNFPASHDDHRELCLRHWFRFCVLAVLRGLLRYRRSLPLVLAGDCHHHDGVLDDGACKHS
mgnify:CR=1 FL=1